MARARGSASTSTAAVQPSKGSKITFGEDDSENDESYEAGPSTSTRTSRDVDASEDEDEDDDEDDDSDDDAPEAVGLGRNEDDVSAAAELLAQYVWYCISVQDHIYRKRV